MKLLSILSAGIFATMTALSFNVLAADDTNAKAPAAETQTDKAPAKKVKRHSHVDEKTGMPMSQQSGAAAKADASQDNAAPAAGADKDRSKHYHPRDGK